MPAVLGRIIVVTAATVAATEAAVAVDAVVTAVSGRSVSGVGLPPREPRDGRCARGGLPVERHAARCARPQRVCSTSTRFMGLSVFIQTARKIIGVAQKKKKKKKARCSGGWTVQHAAIWPRESLLPPRAPSRKFWDGRIRRSPASPNQGKANRVGLQSTNRFHQHIEQIWLVFF